MEPNFSKSPDGLLPAIVQDERTRNVLMLGYMNAEALEKTRQLGKVTFFSRAKQRLWTKGESSQNYLYVQSIKLDCDADTLLIRVRPAGAVCHTGSDTCFDEKNPTNAHFLEYLEKVMEQRLTEGKDSSYTRKLWERGRLKMAQKVGEEGVEVALEGATNNPERLTEEAADLLYHLLLLLKANDRSLGDVMQVLEARHAE